MKVKLLMLVCLLVAVLVVVGCAPAKAPTPKTTVPAEYKSIRMVGGSLGSIATTVVLAYSAMFNKHYPDIQWSSCSGVAATVGVYITKGTLKVGMTTPVAYVDAFGFDKVAESRLRSINLPVPTIDYTFVIPEDKPWKDITEVPKGLTLCPGSPGTSGPPTTEAWLGLVGLSKKDFNWVPLGKQELADAWRTGKVDIAMLSISGYSPGLMDMHTSARKLKALGLTPEQVAKANAQQTFERIGYPQVAKSSLTELTPEVFKYDVTCPSQPYPLICRDDFPEDMAYTMAKTIDEHIAELAQTYAPMKYATAQQNIKWAKQPLTIHSGVLRYYKEKGYLK